MLKVRGCVRWRGKVDWLWGVREYLDMTHDFPCLNINWKIITKQTVKEIT